MVLSWIIECIWWLVDVNFVWVSKNNELLIGWGIAFRKVFLWNSGAFSDWWRVDTLLLYLWSFRIVLDLITMHVLPTYRGWWALFGHHLRTLRFWCNWRFRSSMIFGVDRFRSVTIPLIRKIFFKLFNGIWSKLVLPIFRQLLLNELIGWQLSHVYVFHLFHLTHNAYQLWLDLIFLRFLLLIFLQQLILEFLHLLVSLLKKQVLLL